MLWRMAVLQLILYVRIKGGGMRKDTENPLVVEQGSGRKKKWGHLSDWIKSKTERYILLLLCWVQDS